jgi:hypothetical protein
MAAVLGNVFSLDSDADERMLLLLSVRCRQMRIKNEEVHPRPFLATTKMGKLKENHRDQKSMNASDLAMQL